MLPYLTPSIKSLEKCHNLWFISFLRLLMWLMYHRFIVTFSFFFLLAGSESSVPYQHRMLSGTVLNVGHQHWHWPTHKRKIDLKHKKRLWVAITHVQGEWNTSLCRQLYWLKQNVFCQIHVRETTEKRSCSNSCTDDPLQHRVKEKEELRKLTSSVSVSPVISIMPPHVSACQIMENMPWAE